MAKLIAFIGKPGSGKDTVCRALEKKHGWPLIITGDLLREEVRKQTEIGRRIAPVLAKGEMVSDELVAEIIINAVKKMRDQKVILLNGYPRTLKQAEILEEKLQNENISVSMVIELVVSDETVKDRLTLRRYCPKCGRIYNLKFSPPKSNETCDADGEKLVQREDDREEVVEYRLKRFHEEIKPIREFYEKRNLLFRINAEGNAEEIIKEVENLIKNHV